jgi:hypothetical protein
MMTLLFEKNLEAARLTVIRVHEKNAYQNKKHFDRHFPINNE